MFHANALHAFLETDEFTDRLPLEPAPVLVAPDGREGYVISSLDGRTSIGAAGATSSSTMDSAPPTASGWTATTSSRTCQRW